MECAENSLQFVNKPSAFQDSSPKIITGTFGGLASVRPFCTPALCASTVTSCRLVEIHILATSPLPGAALSHRHLNVHIVDTSALRAGDYVCGLLRLQTLIASTLQGISFNSIVIAEKPILVRHVVLSQESLQTHSATNSIFCIV